MDQRIKHSEQTLKTAYMDLLRSSDPEKITVKRLCTHAGVNRSTFYARYGYLQALEEAILEDCISSICYDGDKYYHMSSADEGIDKETIQTYIDRFLSNETLMYFCMYEKNDLYRSMIIRIQASLSMHDERYGVQYYPAFFQNAGVVETLIEWIRNGRPVPKETLIDIICRFSKAMFNEKGNG